MHRFYMLVLICFMGGCKPAYAHFFDLGRVDFFDEASLKKGLEQAQEQPLDWREPIIGEDGKATYYQPPPVVLAFLENPTEENAQAYLDWENAKSQRIQKAQEVLTALLEKTP